METNNEVKVADGRIFEHNGIKLFQTSWDRKYRRAGPEYHRDLKKLHHVKIRPADDDRMDLHDWCRKNLKGYWYYFDECDVYLTDEEDIWYFKLIWA